MQNSEAMDLMIAVSLIEDGCDIEEDLIDAWQYLINTGLAWSLQGTYGRTAQALIEAGVCYE
jgi:hypothetical protein